MKKLTSNPQAERRWMERLEIITARKHTAAIARVIKSSYLAGLKAYENNEPIDHAVYERNIKMTQDIIKMILEPVDIVRKHVMRMTNRKKSFDINEFFEDYSPEFRLALDTYIKSYTAEHVQNIGETTLRSLKRLVDDAVINGATRAELSKAIRSHAGIDSITRANTIARTELHSAMAKSSLEAAKETGVISMKEWISVDDDRSREAHGEVDPVPVDEPFIVNGHDMMHPGDPAGPPEEVINCRCVMTYLVQD